MSKEDEIRELLMAEMSGSEPVQETAEEVAAEETSDVQDASEETVEASSPETEDEVDGEIVTIKSLAADLEIEPGQLYGMRIPVDGHDPLTIGELKDIAQAKMDSTESAEAEKSEMAERLAELERKEAELFAQTRNVQPQELIKAEAELARAYSEFAAIDWPQLEATNPGEAALRRQKLMEQYQIATYNRDQIQGRMETARTEIQSQREVASQQQMAGAMRQLTSLIPEWRDETVYVREREHMVNQLVDAGISEQSIRSLADPALIKYLRDGLTRDEKIEAAKPKVKAPQVLKASAVQSKGRGKKQADKRFFEHAANSRDQRVKDEAVRRLVFGR